MTKKKKSGIEVIATARGYYDDAIREPGDRFEVEKHDEIGSWMEPVNEVDKEELERLQAAKTKVIARNGENVVTEGSSEKRKAAALKNADPAGEVM